MARSETAYPVRHGTVPRQNLRASHPVSVQMESGFGSSAAISRSRGESGDVQYTCSRAHDHQEATDELEGRHARDHNHASTQDLTIDHGFVAEHCRWLLENGCTGIVALGSLGEGATLSYEEKLQILRTCRQRRKRTRACRRGDLVADDFRGGISSQGCCRSGLRRPDGSPSLRLPGRLARDESACRGGLPSYPAILHAVQQSRRLRNGFPSRTDCGTGGEHANLAAVKESSTDARRVSGIRALLENRLSILVGVDDAVLEAIGVGATGWIAGLANALPRESVELFDCGMQRRAR